MLQLRKLQFRSPGPKLVFPEYLQAHGQCREYLLQSLPVLRIAPAWPLGSENLSAAAILFQALFVSQEGQRLIWIKVFHYWSGIKMLFIVYKCHSESQARGKPFYLPSYNVFY